MNKIKQFYSLYETVRPNYKKKKLLTPQYTVSV